jgi:hypothetical protein
LSFSGVGKVAGESGWRQIRRSEALESLTMWMHKPDVILSPPDSKDLSSLPLHFACPGKRQSKKGPNPTFLCPQPVHIWGGNCTFESWGMIKW